MLVVPFAILVLATLVRMCEKHLVWPYLPADAGTIKPTRYMKKTSEAAEAVGFMPLGAFRDARGGVYKIRYDFLVSPAKDVLLVTGGGAMAGIRVDASWLLTSLSNGRCIVSLDNAAARERGDLTGLSIETIYQRTTFDILLAAHRKAVAAAKAPGVPFSSPVSDHREFLGRKIDMLVQGGYAALCGDSHERWRYTVKGALFSALSSFWHGTGQGLDPEAAEKPVPGADQQEDQDEEARSPSEHRSSSPVLSAKKMKRQIARTFLFWLVFFNWPPVVIWIPFLRALAFLPYMLWINIPVLWCGLGKLLGQTHYDFIGKPQHYLQEFGPIPLTPLSWILVVAFWILIAAGLTAITPLCHALGRYMDKDRVKIDGDITMDGRTYTRRTGVPWSHIYPFFLFHMLIFGCGGFSMAYGDKGPGVFFLYAHSGMAILVYTIFYISIFGVDEVKWMFINAWLGLLGIYSQIDWILSLFGKKAGDYPLYVHVVPFLYFILYTFLLRHAVLDLFRAREDAKKRKRIEHAYVAISAAIYVVSYFLETH